MTTSNTATRPQVLFCGCAHYEIIPRQTREEISAALSRAGLVVEAVSDLCGLAACRDPRLQEWTQSPSLAVVACFPRAVRWLFHAAGVPSLDGRVRFFNMRTQTPEEIIQELMKDDGLLMIEKKSEPSSVPHPSSLIPHQSDWVPWFPVIDYERCRNCQQCLNFCLFGVYALSEAGRVEVRKPSGCKTNCPACARMCPQQAIIFPKYGEPPINGADVPESAQAGAGCKPAPAGDLYDRIRQRAKAQQRFSVGAGSDGSGQPPEVAPPGLCPTLDSLRQELGIPQEVLRSLSPAELGRVAEESRRKLAAKPQGAGNGETRGGEEEHHE
jgi:NAD-dependent dihydropyrimidine dehydrogenase PreA subunit